MLPEAARKRKWPQPKPVKANTILLQNKFRQQEMKKIWLEIKISPQAKPGIPRDSVGSLFCSHGWSGVTSSLLNVPHLQFLTSSAFFIDNRSCHERNSSFPHSVLTCLHLYSSISYPCLYLKALLLVPCVCFPCTAKDSVLSLSFPFPASSVSPSLLDYSSQ